MHSSRMRTGRSLTVFRSLLLWGSGEGSVPGPGGGTWSWGGVPGPPGGVPGPGGCTWSRGVYLVRGGTWSRGGTWLGGGYLVQGGYWSWGVYLARGGVPGLGGYLVPGGVYLVPGGRCTWSGGYLVWGGCTWSGGVPGQVLPHFVNRMTNRCKNITLAKTSFRPVIISFKTNPYISLQPYLTHTIDDGKTGRKDDKTSDKSGKELQDIVFRYFHCFVGCFA